MLIHAENIPKRIEGQVWIDKNSPNRLKYYVNGHEYVVEVSGSYPALNTSSEPINLICGTPVKLSNMGMLMPANFPEDISDIIGVLAETAIIPGATEDGPGKAELSVTKNGWIMLSKNKNVPSTTDPDNIDEIRGVFIDYPSIGDERNNENAYYWNESYWPAADSWHGQVNPPTGIENPKRDNLIGAPVYWYIGGTAGKLTLSTPSGFYWKKENTTANISYCNLPQIGNISKINYTEGETKEIESVEIHVNFAKFDASLEWSWPAVKKAEDHIHPSANNYLESFTIKHGFIINKNFNLQTFHHITCIEANTTRENEVIADVIEDYTTGQCTIKTSNPYDMHYRVSGEINFRVDMAWPSPVVEDPEP